MSRRPSRRFLRQLIEDKVCQYLDEGGDPSLEAALPDLKLRLKDEYKDNQWLELLLQLLIVLLPMILALHKPATAEDPILRDGE